MKLILLCVFVMGLMIGASSGAVQADWTACVREAAVSNQRLQSAKQAIAKAYYNKKSSDAVYLPSVSASGGASVGKRENSVTDNSSSYGVSASQLIYDWGKSKAQSQSAAALIEAAEINYQLASANVRYRLRTAFIGLLKSQEMLDIAGIIVERRQKAARLIKLRYEAGREHKGSLLTSEAKQLQAELQQKKAQRDLDLAKFSLAVELGRDLLKPGAWSDIMVQGEMKLKSDYAVKPDFDAMLIETPSLKDLLIQSRLARYDMDAAKAAFYPSLKARAGVDESSGGWNDYIESYSAGVSISVPLFEGGRNKARYDSANAAMSIANYDEFNGRNDLSSAIRRKWSALHDSLDRMQLSKMFYDASKERARISMVQYSSGIINYDSWIIIEDDYINSEQLLLDANATALISESEWINVKGGTLEQENK